jgi:hypothetical protein
LGLVNGCCALTNVERQIKKAIISFGMRTCLGEN